MEFFTTDLHGVTLIDPPVGERRRILRSTQEETDSEYPEVFLTTGDGTVLGYGSSGMLFQEEAGEIIRVAPGVDPELAEQAWNFLIEGDLASLEALPWQLVD